MNYKFKLIILAALATLTYCPMRILSQDLMGGTISGNFQIEAQSYQPDSLIGAENAPPEKVLSNGFLNLQYQNGNFDIGIRYENYLNPILGYDTRYQGQGIAYRYATYTSDVIDVTAGNFYEQFGSGMILRTYQEPALGYDNSLDGLRFKFRPHNGVELTALIGTQRDFWTQGDGIVRGADLNLTLNDFVPEITPEDISIMLGGSVVSKYQTDNSSKLILPQNVFAYSLRMQLAASSWNFETEYAYKYNDPSSDNNFSYNPGQGLIVSASYFEKGLGLSLSAHKVDNMSFRSDRSARGQVLLINYIPTLTKQHTYALASVYPYATQLNGEAGIQADVTFRLPEDSFLGGEHGTTVNINFSAVNSLDSTRIDDFAYKSDFFNTGKKLLFRDFNIDFTHKWRDDFKTVLTFMNELYDRDVIEHGGGNEFGMVHANTIVLDMTYEFNETHALRLELEHLWATQDSVITTPDNTNGNWGMALAELTIAPHWYFSLMDQYNYGNDDENRQIHYYTASTTYVINATRFQLSYGKQRGGILCVGGICRPVPASNGFYLSVSSSF